MSALKKSDSPGSDNELLGQMAGEYRILRKVGVGGFGTVYEAEHPLLKRKAAVKVLHASPAVDSVAVQRFIEEARSASQISHRHIVDIFSFGQLRNEQYFYVMDLFEGAPLDAHLRRNGRFAPDIALQLLRPIAHALDALHAASIVHRDLKPANIYLAWEDSDEVVPKLLDFGLVKLLGNTALNTASGVPVGTPYYMSPEQCRGDKIDARADIYSFGVVCYEVLTGTRPFTGDSATAVLVAHLMQPPPRISEQCPELHRAFDVPVLRMLAKEPEARPSSAGAALRELERAAQEAGIALHEGLPHLPRPTSERSGDRSLGLATTGVQSGTRSGAQDATKRARMGWGTGALVLALLVAFIALYQLGTATPDAKVAPKAEPAPSAVPIVPSPPAPAAVVPSAPTPAPAETPHAAEPPAAVRQVALTVRGAPPGAAVLLGDQKLGEAPGPILLPYGEQPLQLRVVASGYGPKPFTVTPNAARDVSLAPEKGGRTQTKRGAVSRDLENPF